MNKKDVTDLEELEEYYDTCRKIKFHKDTEIPKSIDEIFKRLVEEYESTFYIRDGNHCIQNKTQWRRGKFRSVDDLIIICKYYLQSDIIDILKYIENYYIKGKENKLRLHNFSYCGNIRKNNFWSKTYYFYINNFYNMRFTNNGFINFPYNISVKNILENNKKEDDEVGNK